MVYLYHKEAQEGKKQVHGLRGCYSNSTTEESVYAEKPRQQKKAPGCAPGTSPAAPKSEQRPTWHQMFDQFRKAKQGTQGRRKHLPSCAALLG